MVSTVPKTRPAYPDEFRREAVLMLRAGRSPRELAESLGVSQQTLRNWRGQAKVTGRERADGLPLTSVTSCAGCGARTRGSSRSAICSNEPRPSSRARPRPGERVPVDLGGE